MSEKLVITECFSSIYLPNIFFRPQIFAAPTTFRESTVDVDQEEGDDDDDDDDDYDDDNDDDEDAMARYLLLHSLNCSKLLQHYNRIVMSDYSLL